MAWHLVLVWVGGGWGRSARWQFTSTSTHLGSYLRTKHQTKTRHMIQLITSSVVVLSFLTLLEFTSTPYVSLSNAKRPPASLLLRPLHDLQCLVRPPPQLGRTPVDIGVVPPLTRRKLFPWPPPLGTPQYRGGAPPMRSTIASPISFPIAPIAPTMHGVMMSSEESVGGMRGMGGMGGGSMGGRDGGRVGDAPTVVGVH